MEILEQKQIKKLKFIKRGGRGKNTDVYDKIGELEVGQGLLIKAEEWQSKASLATSIGSMTYASKRTDYAETNGSKRFLNKSFSVRSLEDKSGWVVIRIE